MIVIMTDNKTKALRSAAYVCDQGERRGSAVGAKVGAYELMWSALLLSVISCNDQSCED